jgi:hypothetical protein
MPARLPGSFWTIGNAGVLGLTVSFEVLKEATNWRTSIDVLVLLLAAMNALIARPPPRSRRGPAWILALQDRYTQLRMDFFAGLAGLVERLQQGVAQKPDPGPLQVARCAFPPGPPGLAWCEGGLVHVDHYSPFPFWPGCPPPSLPLPLTCQHSRANVMITDENYRLLEGRPAG